jgi:hypothetical protein
VPELLAGGELEALGDDGVIPRDDGMRGGLGHPHQRAQAQTLRPDLDPGAPRAREPVDVDEQRWAHHVELHQVEERRPSRDELHRRVGRCPRAPRPRRASRLDGGVGAFGAAIGEGAHHAAPRPSRACSTAATMLG